MGFFGKENRSITVGTVSRRAPVAYQGPCIGCSANLKFEKGSIMLEHSSPTGRGVLCTKCWTVNATDPEGFLVTVSEKVHRNDRGA